MLIECETVPCMYCGAQTSMLGTKQCNNCWEVASRVSGMPIGVLSKILVAEIAENELTELTEILVAVDGC